MDKGKLLAISVVANVVLVILLLVARGGAGNVEQRVSDEQLTELLSFEREVLVVLESGDRDRLEILKERVAEAAAVHEEELRESGVDIGPAP